MPHIPGYSFGLSLGRAVREKLFSNDGMVIAHRTRGRRRYICLALKDNADACAELERILRTFPGMLSVRVSPILSEFCKLYTNNPIFCLKER